MPGYDSLGSNGSPVGMIGEGCLPGSAYTYRKWCGIRRSTWLLVMYTTAYLTFLMLGGWAMGQLEEWNQDQMRAEIRTRKRHFLENNPGLNATDLEEFIRMSFYYRDRGVSVLERDLTKKKWNVGDALLFTVTVVTTIGYGHIHPVTSAGKLFCIGFSIIGIPFTLIFLTASVQRLLAPTCQILAFFFARLGERISPFAIRVIHLVVMSIFFIIFFMLIPSGLFYLLEPEWSFLDGFYFVFISLTTIGLGDYIPGDNDAQVTFRELYKAAVAIYLLLGLVFMTLTATVFYDIPQLNLGTVLHQHKDIHLPTERDQDEKASLRSSIRSALSRSLKRAKEDDNRSIEERH